MTRDELRGRLWPDNRVVEFEQGLNAIINRLREALGDSADKPRFVETLPRRGYRFVGEIGSSCADAGAGTGGAARRMTNTPSLPTRIVAGLAIALIALAITAAAFWIMPASPAPCTGRRADRRDPSDFFAWSGTHAGTGRRWQQLAFAWDGESGVSAGFDLFVRTLDSERLTRLTHAPAPALAPAWSPDGSRIVFARMGEKTGFFSIAATGGAEQTGRCAVHAGIAHAPGVVARRQDACLFFDERRRLAPRVADAAGGQLEPAVDGSPACWHAGAPAFSADGRHLAFVCMTGVAIYSVYVAEVDGAANTRPRVLARFQGVPQGIAWRDARRILVANDSGDGSGIWSVNLDGTRSRPAIAEDALAAGVSADDGRVVYSRARSAIDIWRIAPGGNEPARKWIFSTRSQMTPQFSPDGQHIAFQSNRSGSPEIWLSDADGSNATRLTDFNGPLTGGPSWCADGRRLAFDSRESGISAIYIVDVRERVPRRVPTPQTNLALPVWSADCRWLLASDGREALYRVPAGGGEAQRFTPLRSYQSAVAGERVVFNAVESAYVSLWAQSLEGGDAAALPGMPRLAYADSWAANARSLFFTDSSAEPATLRRYDFASHQIEELARLPNKPTALGGLGLAVSADGKNVLYTHTEDLQSDLVIATLD